MTSLDSTAVPDGVSAQQSAGTPSPFREAVFPARAALELESVLCVVAGTAAGPPGEAPMISALDAAVLADQPLLRISHGMGTGVTVAEFAE